MTASHQISESDNLIFEKQLSEEGFSRIMGLDEVGRGCLAGPVVASGVILDPEKPVEGVTDSKLLKSSSREKLAGTIKKKALCWTIAWCENTEIDKLNILKASLQAMVRCVEKTNPVPDYLLVDGNKGLETLMIPSMTLVSGDRLSASIAAASILAKVYRDNIMKTYHREYPEFGWDKNVGYPTAVHYDALGKFGYTPYHRRSFRLKTDKAYTKRP